MSGLNRTVVLVTGALTGIGRAAAVIFAQEGAQVVVSGRRDKRTTAGCGAAGARRRGDLCPCRCSQG